MSAQCFIGTGKVKIRKAGTTGGFVAAGQVSKFELSLSDDVKEVKDHMDVGGGIYDSAVRIGKAEASVDFNDWYDMNVAFGLAASVTPVANGTVTAEAITVDAKDLFFPLAHINPSAVVVKDDADLITYVAGTDYEVQGSGLFIPAGSAILVGDVIHVGYTYSKQSQLEVLKDLGGEYELMIDGLNEAHTNIPHRLTVYRCKISPSNMSFIADDFGVISCKFTVLKAEGKGAGKSAYAKFEVAKV